MKFLPVLVISFSLLLSSGCSWLGFGDDDDKKDDESGYTEKEFYDRIQSSLDAQSWSIAIENLHLLESQFPFGKYAEQAQLELIYAQYRTADYESSIASADRFIRLHPQHPNVDYAFYLKGLSELSQSSGFFDSFLPTDNTTRDPGTARNAYATLSELLSRFPNSPYAPDARKRLINLRNHLARAEIQVANYYFARQAYVAAANRGRYVVENFQQTPAVPDALAVMAQAYHLLGKEQLASDAARILAENYPDHPAVNKNGEFVYERRFFGDDFSLMNTITFGLIKRDSPPKYDSREIYDRAFRESGKIQDKDEQERRSIWSRMTFGLFD